MHSPMNKYTMSVPFLYMWSTPRISYHEMLWNEDIDEGITPPPKNHFSLLPQGNLQFSPDDMFSRGHDVLIAYRVIRPFSVYTESCDEFEAKFDAQFCWFDHVPHLIDIDTSTCDFIDRTCVYVLKEAHATGLMPSNDGFAFDMIPNIEDYSRPLHPKKWTAGYTIPDSTNESSDDSSDDNGYIGACIPYDDPTKIVGTTPVSRHPVRYDLECAIQREEFTHKIEKMLSHRLA